MRSSDLVRIARDRAGLTQMELAARSGRSRETIARWESGAQAPSLDAVTELVHDCGLDLVLRLANRDTSLVERVQEQLELTPPKRLARLMPADSVREVMRGLRWLARTRTPSIVIGSVGAALLGGPQRPEGTRVDFVSADPVAAEQEMRSAGLMAIDAPEPWEEFDAGASWTLPKGGVVALATSVPGVAGYKDLRRDAIEVQVDARNSVRVAHPRDLLRMADASGREGERARVPGLQALLEETT